MWEKNGKLSTELLNLSFAVLGAVLALVALSCLKGDTGKVKMRITVTGIVSQLCDQEPAIDPVGHALELFEETNRSRR